METPTLTVRVARKHAEAADIASYEFRRLDGSPLPAFEAGAHIDVHLPGGLTRQYSLSNDPADTAFYRIAVLRDPQSRGGSAAIHDEVHEGDSIVIGSPRNHFPLAAKAGRHLLMAGGIGLTPILCMAQHLARTGEAFDLHYCSRSRERAAFLDEIGAAAWAPRAQFHFDDEDEAQKLRIGEVLEQAQSDTHLYVCGPQGFMNAMLDAARAQGWSESRLHYEFFTAPAVDHTGDAPFEVRLAQSGRTFTVPADKSITTALYEAGVYVPVSCEQGICGTCMTRVIEGRPDHRDMFLSPEEQACNQQILPCCSRSKSKLLVLDL